ncbi:hypothetical protein PtA15_1A116 [Puccinia triticina]|uniref:Uncharacterized protein n=1 Tax=Puccinia triticina TaxID=208348 RepID=A0ABY7C7B7_9BASI|nr:uncharacterized protein PtA15_1A116 [Puccinia triticina]WAQ80778.1 hypothetical protein PtA15_1A116 [Puccinia triticina]
MKIVVSKMVWLDGRDKGYHCRSRARLHSCLFALNVPLTKRIGYRATSADCELTGLDVLLLQPDPVGSADQLHTYTKSSEKAATDHNRIHRSGLGPILNCLGGGREGLAQRDAYKGPCPGPSRRNIMVKSIKTLKEFINLVHFGPCEPSKVLLATRAGQ